MRHRPRSRAGRERQHLLLGRTGGQLADEQAVTHHQDAVGHPDHLGQLAGDHQHGDAVGGELAHQLVDRVLGADVDAAGGLVHQHDARSDAEPAGEHDLLLVAAGEELHLLVEATGRDLEARQHAGQLAPCGAGARRQHRADDAEGVVEDRLVEREALGLAVLGDEREPAADALAGAAHADGRAVERHGAAVERVHAEDRLDELGAARALEPGQADDLAGADREVDPVDVRVAGARQGEPDLADLGARELSG